MKDSRAAIEEREGERDEERREREHGVDKPRQRPCAGERDECDHQREERAEQHAAGGRADGQYHRLPSRVAKLGRTQDARPSPQPEPAAGGQGLPGDQDERVADETEQHQQRRKEPGHLDSRESDGSHAPIPTSGQPSGMDTPTAEPTANPSTSDTSARSGPPVA